VLAAGLGTVLAMNDDEDGLAAGLAKARESMSPQQRKKLDEVMRDQLLGALNRLHELEQLLVALRLLHREDRGERSGFCAECGNVTPCQTRKFLEPFESQAAR
jgi:hypothetical protein